MAGANWKRLWARTFELFSTVISTALGQGQIDKTTPKGERHDDRDKQRNAAVLHRLQEPEDEGLGAAVQGMPRARHRQDWRARQSAELQEQIRGGEVREMQIIQGRTPSQEHPTVGDVYEDDDNAYILTEIYSGSGHDACAVVTARGKNDKSAPWHGDISVAGLRRCPDAQLFLYPEVEHKEADDAN